MISWFDLSGNVPLTVGAGGATVTELVEIFVPDPDPPGLVVPGVLLVSVPVPPPAVGDDAANVVTTVAGFVPNMMSVDVELFVKGYFGV